MSSKELGSYIKKYRKNAKMSQLDLEITTGLAIGSLSKIENGSVNPTKETIYKIIEALDLTPIQSSKLFQLDLEFFRNVLDLSHKLHSIEQLDKVMQTACDDIVKTLNIDGLGIYLVEDNIIKFKSISLTRLSKIALDLIPYSIDNVEFDLNKDENVIVQCVNEKRPLLTHSLYELNKPALSMKVAEAIEKLTKINTFFCIPLLNDDNKVIGTIIFTKKGKGDFADELQFLNSFAFMISNIIIKIKEQE